MIQYSSKYRSQQEEIMDDFNLSGDEMKALLGDLKRVNTWLGGRRLTLNGINKLIAAPNKTITIIDVGCGDGEMLRECAKFGKRKGYEFRLIGIDANANIIKEAENRSSGFENINFYHLDVFAAEFHKFEYDIALFTLFLHHFNSADISEIIKKTMSEAKVGVVINDLQRSKLAFYLFKIFSRLVLRTSIARNDGLISIARGFKKNELKELATNFMNTQSTIKWFWAFRYQWLIKKII